MQPSILALDLSLASTGVSCSVCGESVITTKKVEGEERLVLIRDTIETMHLTRFAEDGGIAEEGHVDLVVLEGYAFARPNQAHQIGELGGVIRVMLYEQDALTKSPGLGGLPWLAIPPARLKKWATDNGNANKDEMLASAIRNHGYEGSNNNEADAYLLRKMAEAHYSGIEQPKYRKAIDREISWPSVDISEGSAVP